MTERTKSILDRATRALRDDVPDANATEDSAERVAQKLGIALSAGAASDSIHSCRDVQRLFSAYRADSLPEAKALLVKAHLHDCGVCLRQFREGSGAGAVDWSAPRIASSPRNRMAWSWGFAAAALLLIAGAFVYRAYWAVPAGVRAEVQSVDGAAYLVSDNVDHRIMPGTELREGDRLRTTGGSRAVLRLSDGSTVEMNQRSTVAVGARGQNMTVALDHGAVIVQAAHRTSGHLYVRTPDCRVAVTGTVFTVDAGLKGSRVAVLQGSVQVAHAGLRSVLRPGEQLATSEALAPEPLAQQFAWSPDRQKYIGIIAELANVEHQIAQIPFPQARYASDLLARVPSDTLLYISIPNLGDYIAQANSIFQDQLKQSPQLQEWWLKSHARNPNALNEVVAKLHDISQYLGNEVVVIGYGAGKQSGLAVIADVQRSGLEQELKQQFVDNANRLTVLNPATLASASETSGPVRGGYALVRDREVVFSNNLANLRKINAQLDAGASGFASSGFGQQIGAAYSRGAGIILAANLHDMIRKTMAQAPQNPHKQAALESTGLGGLEYLIAEHRENNGLPQNHLNLQFAGTRQRIASWLASPAPMASLDFVSPNAAVAFGTLTKDPAAIADDLMQIATQNGKAIDWNEIDSKLRISVRDDLMANLNGEFLFAFDGPVLPTPSWKIVIGVNNPEALETALERVAAAIRSQMQDPNAHPVTIEPSTVSGRRYYALHDEKTGAVLAYYTFADGYMIVAPTEALIMDALQSHEAGNSLARSASFRALLPHDQNENYSAVAYQNLSPVLTPLLSQFNGEAANALQKLAADSRPTVICAWGQDNRIEVASDSRLFGFDFLTLGAIFDRNKPHLGNVNR
ncbi:MAG: FecR domain-containing protein [Acidobacteriota bacterium]